MEDPGEVLRLYGSGGTVPYRKPEWLNILYENHWPIVVPNNRPHRVPLGYLPLKSLMETTGRASVAGWDGTEDFARTCSGPPDPPWNWPLIEPEGKKLLTFTDENYTLMMDSRDAERWWHGVEVQIVGEWTESERRWEQCRELVVRMLEQGEVEAAVHTVHGVVVEVPVAFWRTSHADEALANAYIQRLDLAIDSGEACSGVLVVRENAVKSTGTFMWGTPLSLGLGERAVTQTSMLSLDQLPYLKYMLEVAGSSTEIATGKALKKTVEAYLRDHWPKSLLGAPTPTKLRNMATFLRHPDTEAGGVKKQQSR